MANVNTVEIGTLGIKAKHSSDVSEPCFLCGKELKGAELFVEVIGGGVLLVASGDADDEDRGYMGWQAVGSTCARKARKAGAVVKTEEEL